MVGPVGRGIAWRDRVGTDGHPRRLHMISSGSMWGLPLPWEWRRTIWAVIPCDLGEHCL